MTGRQVLQQAIGLATGDGLRGCPPFVRAAALERPHLGQQQEIRPVLAHRLLDQAAGLGEVGRLVVDRAHLDHAHTHPGPSLP